MKLSVSSSCGRQIPKRRFLQQQLLTHNDVNNQLRWFNRSATHHHIYNKKEQTRSLSTTFPIDIRNEFQSLVDNKDIIFADGAGGSQVHNSVIDSMVYQMRYGSANLGGNYSTSQLCFDTTRNARQAVADLLNCNQQEIIFGLNMTSLTFHIGHSLFSKKYNSQFAPIGKNDNIVLSYSEHDANAGSWIQLAKEIGCNDIRFIPLNLETGTLDISELDNIINENTKLIATSLACNGNGSINYKEAKIITDIASSIGAISFFDAVHYIPHNLIDVQKLNCDFLVCSSYKFFGPHSGILYGKEEKLSKIKPYKIRPATNDLPSDDTYQISAWELGTQNFEALAGIIACINYIASIGDRFDTSTTTSTSTINNNHSCSSGVASTTTTTTYSTSNSNPRRESIIKAYKVIEEHENQLKYTFLNGISSIPSINVLGIETIDEIGLKSRTPTFAIHSDNITSTELTQRLVNSGIWCTSGNHYCMFWKHAYNIDGALRFGLLHYNTVDEVTRILEALDHAMMITKS